MVGRAREEEEGGGKGTDLLLEFLLTHLQYLVKGQCPAGERRKGRP